MLEQDPERRSAGTRKASWNSDSGGPENIQQAGFGQRRSPLLQAYIDEDPTGATEKRISDFERSNTIKACAIIACLFVFVVTWDPVVP